MEGKELSFKHLPIAPLHPLKQLPVEFKGRLVDQAEFQPYSKPIFFLVQTLAGGSSKSLKNPILSP